MNEAESLITSIDKLPPLLAASICAEEKIYIAEIEKRGFLPFGVTPHFASLAGPEQDDPIRRQFFPDPREALPDSFALDDPLGEGIHRAAPRLVHQYRDRALLLAGGACAGYCRHCFRRVWLSGAPAFISMGDTNGATANCGELAPVLAYLAAHSEIREILVSGGDPLTASNARLEELFCKLRKARPGILLRVCTRAPITSPPRLCEETVALFRKFRPLRLVVHINHPRELAAPGRERLAACVEAGIPVHIQTVLLKGVNDDPALLAALFRDCLDLGLSPYYLFQLDLAPGTAHFRVPLRQGLAIYQELCALFSGRIGADTMALPTYALDLPGGGGKIWLHEGVIAGEKMTAAGPVYLLQDGRGKVWEYPV
ncbi:KamA family radical SAM protein [Spirochaetia bacterium]|nr:KamA family radical SAM protein [Spirochaetia bacterium]